MSLIHLLQNILICLDWLRFCYILVFRILILTILLLLSLYHWVSHLEAILLLLLSRHIEIWWVWYLVNLH